MFETKLLEKNIVAEDTIEMIFEKPEGYSYKTGQHTSLTIKNSTFTGNDQTHTFSYTSDPDSDHVSFLTRVRDSKYKKSLANANISDPFELSAPSGFKIGDGLKAIDNLLYIAAGVGITPLLSYLRASSSSDPSVDLMWSNKSIATTPLYRQFTEGDFSKLSKLDLTFFMTREEGDGDFKNSRITLDEVASKIESTQPERVYIIGQPNFVDDIWSLLLSYGFSDEKIVTENFGGY